MERNQASKRHLLSREHRGRDKSGYRKKPSEQGALTSWRAQRGGQVRIQKETDQARSTHFLEMAEGGTSQDMEGEQPSKGCSLPGDPRGRDKWDMEKNQPNKGHSLSGEPRGRDKSGHRKKLAEQWALTDCRPQWEGQVRTQKGSDQVGALTNWRWQREGQIKTWKKSD